MPPLARRILIAAGVAAGAVAAAALVAALLLLGTPIGARWALSWVSGGIPAGRLTVREVRGSLVSPLELRGLEYRTDSLSVSAERLYVRWELSRLLWREADISVLRADSVRIHPLLARPPAQAPGAVTLPDVRLPVGVRVGELRLRNFAYVPAGDSGAFVLDEAFVAADFHGDLLRISALRARSPRFEVDLHGNLRPRREYPMELALSGRLRLPERPEVHGRARIAGSVERARVSLRLDAPCQASVEAKLSQVLTAPGFEGRLAFSRLDPHGLLAAAPNMQLKGSLAARGTPTRFETRGRISMRSDSLGAAEASVAIVLQGDSMRVDSLLVSVPGTPRRLRVRGGVAGLGGVPRADLDADWQGLVWPLRGDTLVCSDRGRLHLAGAAAGYALRFDGGLRTARMDLGRWRMAATGDTAHLDVAGLEGELYGGAVQAKGAFAWKPRVRWNGTLRGDGLDPGRQWPEWPGHISLEVGTEGELRDTTLAFEARIERLEGTLKQLPLTGHGSVSAAGRSWSARDVRLDWGQARLTADGTAGERFDVAASLAAPDLGPFLDGASGSLRAELRLTGRHDEPRLGLEARGDSLGLAQLQVAAVNIRMDAGLREGDPLRLDLDARRALLGALPLDTLSLHGEGDTNHHTLSGSAEAAGDTVRVAVSGELVRQHWRGSLDRLDLHTRQSGVWRLEAPVAISAAAREARVDSFSVRSGGGSVRGEADWNAGTAVHAHITLTTLPTGLIDPWLPAGARVIGSLDGSIDASAEHSQGPLTARVRLTQTPALLIYSVTPAQRDTIHVGESRLSLDSDAGGARGMLGVEWESGDRLDMEVTLPGFNALRPDTLHQPLAGFIRSHASDLSVVGVYVAGLDNTRGQLTADLQLKGTLRRPEVDGEVLLRDARGSIPALGVTLEDATLAIHCEPGNRISLEGSIRSGKGTVTATGTAEMLRMGWPVFTLGVKGKDFTVADTREANVHVSPDLQIKLDPSRIDVSGQVDVPFARLVSLGRAAQLPVPPSSDVVFVGREADSARAGPKLFSRVRVVIGDDVEVRVPTFRGTPEGSILTIDEPGQATRATGELKVSKGTYRAYGQDLEIERGRLIFGGGPITNPGLDLRASRTATDGTIAGVQITGTVEKPELALFSTPAMSQSDALSYIMFGKPVKESEGGSGAAGSAASQLGVSGTDMLARGVAGKFGIQDASVESKAGTMEDASLFIGTYLSPKLYVSYGIGLFESSSTIRMNYKMTRHWSVQTETGSAHSGLIQYTGEH